MALMLLGSSNLRFRDRGVLEQFTVGTNHCFAARTARQPTSYAAATDSNQDMIPLHASSSRIFAAHTTSHCHRARYNISALCCRLSEVRFRWVELKSYISMGNGLCKQLAPLISCYTSSVTTDGWRIFGYNKMVLMVERMDTNVQVHPSPCRQDHQSLTYTRTYTQLHGSHCCVQKTRPLVSMAMQIR